METFRVGGELFLACARTLVVIRPKLLAAGSMFHHYLARIWSVDRAVAARVSVLEILRVPLHALELEHGVVGGQALRLIAHNVARHLICMRPGEGGAAARLALISDRRTILP